VLSGFMAVAYFMGHGSKGNVLLPMLNQGELAIAWSFLFLYMAVVGAGAWALDNVIGRNRAAALQTRVA
jgi:putative oxidoreductase